MKNIKKISALILSITMIVTLCGSIVKPSAAGEVLPAEDVGTYGAYHISCYSAQLKLTFSNGIHKYLDECGFYIGTSESNLQKVSEKGSFHPETIWYTMSEWGIDLEPSTTYYYKIYYVLSSNGNTYEAPLKSFKTTAHTEGSWVKISDATCTAAGKSIKQCTVCNKIIDTQTQNALSHTPGEWQTITEANCVVEGKQIRLCNACGVLVETRTIPNEDEHDDGVWKIDFEATADHDGQMSRYCTRCGSALETKTFAFHTHSEGYESILRNASCTQDGEKGIFCAECGACYATEIIPATSHGETVTVTTLKPSCTQAGQSVDFCKDCGEIIASEEIPATEHDEGVWQIMHPATCTTEGEESRVCTTCKSVVETRAIEALGHDDGVWTVTKEATCEATGEEICTCTRCGEKIDSRTIEALGHDDGVWKIDFEATPDHDGQMSRYCSRCNMVLESKTFKLHTHFYGHTETLIPAGCLTKGEIGKVCASCGVVYETEEIDQLGHDYSLWYKNNDGTHSRTCTRCHALETNNCTYVDTVTAPTCTEGGYTTHVCSVCGFTYVDAYTEALGHDWSEWAECEDECCHERECQRDGCKAKEISAHNWSEWEYNKDGTLFCNGTKTRVCPDCGATETEEAHHTSWFCRIFYPIIVFVGNIVHKLIYIVSLNWLFPELTIYPTI